MKALVAALALVAAAGTAYARGPVEYRVGYPMAVQQQASSNNDVGVALIGGLILGAIIANNQPQQPQVIQQQPAVQIPVYTEQYLPPNCRPVYDQFGRFLGCFR